MDYTLFYNIVPCKREAWPRLAPLTDLTQNVTIARDIVEKTGRFFKYKPDCAYFSGYAQRTDDPYATFYVQLWDDDHLFRTLAFKNLGYAGILHVEPDEYSMIEWTIDVDWVRVAFEGFDEIRETVEGLDRERLCWVDGDSLTVTFPYRP